MPKEIAKDNSRTAPELPPDLAKQYGLTHHQGTESSTVSVTSKPPKDISPLADDPKLDQAVDDILIKESDAQLEAQDNAAAEAPEATKKRGRWGRLFHSKWLWYSVLLLCFAAGSVLAVLPKTRYAALNRAGVRSTASVTVVDEATTLPLKNVTVSLGAEKKVTDKNGIVRFTGVRLGNYTLTINRPAFASYTRGVTIGWGSNPLGKYRLKAVGLQYTVHVQDYLSGKPLAGAEVDSDGYTALAAADGKVTITREAPDSTEVTALVSLPGYRTEAIRLATAGQTTVVQLVPDKKIAYVSRASGKYDVYSSDIDGNNKKLLLPGTGNESSSFSLVLNTNNTHAAVVATRESTKSTDGVQLRSLTIVDLRSGVNTTIERAEQIQLVDWIGNRLIYRTTTAGLEASDRSRNKLIAYNFSSNARLQLAAAEQFVFVMSAKGSLYYAPTGSQKESTLGLYRVQPDGSGQHEVMKEEVWSGMRTAYNTLALQTGSGWYSHTFGESGVSQVASPTNPLNIVYVDNAKHRTSALIAPRTGTADIMVHDSGTETVLASQVGATYPLYWIDDKTVAYTVTTAGESAAYVLSTGGGQPHKVADITPVFGFSRGL